MSDETKYSEFAIACGAEKWTKGKVVETNKGVGFYDADSNLISFYSKSSDVVHFYTELDLTIPEKFKMVYDVVGKNFIYNKGMLTVALGGRTFVFDESIIGVEMIFHRIYFQKFNDFIEALREVVK